MDESKAGQQAAGHGKEQGEGHVLGIATVDDRMLALIGMVALWCDVELAPAAVPLPLAA